MEAYLGQILLFGGSYAPFDHLPCDGRLLPILEYEALFALLGTTYGGDGQTTFGLPDLRGRVPIHPGQGMRLGEALGAATLGEAFAAPGTDVNVVAGNQDNRHPSLAMMFCICVAGVFPSRP